MMGLSHYVNLKLKLIILSASKLPSTCDAFCSRSFIMYFFLKLDYKQTIISHIFIIIAEKQTAS